MHVLSAASGYRTWVAHVATAQPALPAGGATQVVVRSPVAGAAPDVYVVPTGTTGSGHVEVHVLSAASGWQAFSAHAVTPLDAAAVRSVDWTFLPGRGGDLVGVLHGGTTGSGRTEVHVLSRASGFTTWTAHTATPSALTDDATSHWAAGDADGDGVPDAVLLLTASSGSDTTEVHGLGGAGGFGAWTAHSATQLGLPSTSPWQLTLG